MARLITIIALGLGIAAALAVGLVTLTYPAAAAVACPQCYGFERLAPQLFVESAMSDRERRQAVEITAEAQSTVEDFYGAQGASPRILICASATCYRRIGGGGSRGIALLDIALFLSPRGANKVIATHELAHIELHRRIGRLGTLQRVIPQWFDEGLAVVISDDRRYLKPPQEADRCLEAPNGELPTTVKSWTHSLSGDQLYAKAACRVSRWMAARGGAKAVFTLLDRIAEGEDFASAYR